MLVPEIKKLSTLNLENKVEYLDISPEDLRAERFNIEISEDDKLKVKFIKKIESIVRRSSSYKRYIGFLRNEVDIHRCTFLPFINIEELRNTRLEFHHYPFTLFDIVSIVLNDYLDTVGKLVSPFIIAKEVLKLHYQNRIGLVPLSVTAHQLAGDGKLFINLKYVKGNYKKFVKIYLEQIELLKYNELLASLETMSKQEDESGVIHDDILSKKFININLEGRDNEFKSIDIELPKEA